MSACSGEHLHWYLCCPHGEAHRKPLRLQPPPPRTERVSTESWTGFAGPACGSGSSTSLLPVGGLDSVSR